jgi:hypothetical protein
MLRRNLRAECMVWVMLAAAGPLAARGPAGCIRRQDPAEIRRQLEGALRRFFATDRPVDSSMQEILALVKGREDLLAEALKAKTFVAPSGTVARRGIIDAQDRFQDLPPDPSPESRRIGKPTVNAALFHGPVSPGPLSPLVVFVPDVTTTDGFDQVLVRDGTGRGRFVFLVPDEKQDNRWNPTQHERRRHVGPLRDLLLTYSIDPDRVFLVGTGRGGHATWDVGLTYADRWAGLFPCNGGLIHEGGYKASGGVFLENAKSLVIHTVYNTTFDHGIEGCRYAAKKFREWGYRFDAVEEPRFRNMDIPEAMEKFGDASRDAHPREIVKRFNHLDAGEHFWLRALDRVPGEWNPFSRIQIRGKWPDDPEKQREMMWDQVRKECALLKGAIQDNRISVTAEGIGKLRVYFDPAIVDYRAKVTVTINGKMRPPVALEKKADVMLRHVHETGDTSRLYWAFRDFAVNE